MVKINGSNLTARDRIPMLAAAGALLSKISFNEGQSIPGIAHGVVLEHYEG